MYHWKRHCLEWHKTGSNYICNPPINDTDVDFLLLVQSIQNFTNNYANPDNWITTTNLQTYEGTTYNFVSYRKDNFNLIVTENPSWYRRFLIATLICKEGNITDKDERIKKHKEFLEMP